LYVSVLAYAGENKVLRDNLHTVKRHAEVLIITSAEVNLDKILGKLYIYIYIYLFICLVKRMQAKLKIKRYDKLFKNLANLEHFGTTPINQNCMHEEIREE
jgi:hypothetical protein